MVQAKHSIFDRRSDAMQRVYSDKFQENGLLEPTDVMSTWPTKVGTRRKGFSRRNDRSSRPTRYSRCLLWP